MGRQLEEIVMAVEDEDKIIIVHITGVFEIVVYARDPIHHRFILRSRFRKRLGVADQRRGRIIQYHS